MRQWMLVGVVLVGVVLVATSRGVCFGQDEGRPATSNVPGQAFPRIDSELRGTFRFKAPEAKKVTLRLGGNQDVAMAKGADGVWAATTGALVPGFHYYWFVV